MHYSLVFLDRVGAHGANRTSANRTAAAQALDLKSSSARAPVRVTVLRERSYFCFRSAYVGLAAANACSAASGSSWAAVLQHTHFLVTQPFA